MDIFINPEIVINHGDLVYGTYTPKPSNRMIHIAGIAYHKSTINHSDDLPAAAGDFYINSGGQDRAWIGYMSDVMILRKAG